MTAIRVLLALLVVATTGCGGTSEPPAPPRGAAGTLSDATAPPAPAPAPPSTPVLEAAPPAATTIVEPHQPRHEPLPAAPAKSQVAVAPIPKPTTSAPPSKETTSSTTITRQEATATRELPPVPGRDAPRPPTTERQRPTPPVAAPVRPGYSGPSTGTIRWSGVIEKDSTITFEGDQASTGFVIGALPGVPVLIQVFSKEMVVAEPPSAASGWKRVTLRSRTRQTSLLLQWTVLP